MLNSCFKLLRDPAPQPLPRLSLGNRILSEYESNQEWVSALHSQCSWPDPFDERLHALVLSIGVGSCAHLLGEFRVQGLGCRLPSL